jgi:hypothetical protein
VNGKQFIVAEISKNWSCEEPATGPLLCQLFEDLIATNLLRGYRLHSFQLHRLLTDTGSMNETIIAVFRSARSLRGE